MTIIDQKVREKLAKVAHQVRAYCDNDGCEIKPADYAYADAILQSPDLRVEIVEPKYKVWASDGNWEVSGGRFNGRWGAKFQKEEYADEYCDWLNSKEPK